MINLLDLSLFDYNEVVKKVASLSGRLKLNIDIVQEKDTLQSPELLPLHIYIMMIDSFSILDCIHSFF